MNEEANVSWPANVVPKPAFVAGSFGAGPNPFPNNVRAIAEVYDFGDISVAIHKRDPRQFFISLHYGAEVKGSSASYSSFDVDGNGIDVDLDGLITVLTFIREQNKNDNQ